jgi:murein L,D-transpeptidase YcbB/YkuD
MAAPTSAEAPATLPEPQTASTPPLDPVVEASVRTVLSSGEHPSLKWSAIPDVTADLEPLYSAEPDWLLWFDGARPVPSLERTLATLAAAADHGLDPADYDVAALSELWRAVKAGSAPASDRALFDVGLSVAAARMLRAVHTGRVDPATMHWGYRIERKAVDPRGLLRDVRDGRGLAASLDALQPPFAHYARARRVLAAYRKLAAAGEPEVVPELPRGQTKVEPGKTWAGVPQLAARLRVLGDLSAGAAGHSAPTAYAGPIVEAVKRFQERHGLEADGVVGAGTIRAINVPLSQRVRQIDGEVRRLAVEDHREDGL